MNAKTLLGTILAFGVGLLGWNLVAEWWRGAMVDAVKANSKAYHPFPDYQPVQTNFHFDSTQFNQGYLYRPN